MKKIFTAIEKILQQGDACCFVALLESEGSTPRSSGAYMLVSTQGLQCGTIGGGAMEYAALQLAQQRLQLQNYAGFAKTYDLSPQAGMACGGSCRVQFCFLAGAEDLRLAQEALAYLDRDEAWWLLLPCGAGKMRIKKELALAGRRGQLVLDGCTYYAEQYGYDGTVYVFGAGHVARELVPLLAHLNFRCVVLDDRAEFADAAAFPAAAAVRRVDFAQLNAAYSLTAQDYAVVMTRGHLYDAQCERFLLHTDAGYIGIMGSKNKARLAREALLAEGYTQEQLARITTPIGISIGSETPAEIAVSIAAQLIQVRAAKKI